MTQRQQRRFGGRFASRLEALAELDVGQSGRVGVEPFHQLVDTASFNGLGRIADPTEGVAEGGDDGTIRFDGAFPHPVREVEGGAEQFADVAGAGLNRVGVLRQELGPNASQRAPVPRILAPSCDGQVHCSPIAVGRLPHATVPRIPRCSDAPPLAT